MTNSIVSTTENAVANAGTVVPASLAGTAKTNVVGGLENATSNAIASAEARTPPGSATGEQAGGTGWTFSALLVLAAAVAGAAVAKRRSFAPATGRARNRTYETASRSDSNDIEDDVLAAVAPDAANREALRVELATAFAGTGKPSDSRLADILRVEESFEKAAGSKYLRRVSILRRKDGTTGILSKVESEIGWEYVPDAVRGEFIRTRGEKIVRLVYDAGKANRK